MEGEHTGEGGFKNGIQIIPHVTNKPSVLPPFRFCSIGVWGH